MSLQSWMIKSWPTCKWHLPLDPGEWPVWWHMSTHVREHPDHAGRCIGDTVWMTTVDDDRTLAAAWEWTELQPGVVVLSDPNSILSNGRFVLSAPGADDELLTAIELNRIAHALPWQQTVCAVLRTLRAHPQLLTAQDAEFRPMLAGPQALAA